MNYLENKFLVTGGAGFVGSYIVEMLLAKNAKKVIIVDNMIRGSHRNMESFSENPNVEFIEGDIRDKVLMEELISQVDYVFHLAAVRITRYAADPIEGFEVMVRATHDIFHLCVKHNIKKVIYSSTASVYGLAQHFPTPETDNPYDNKTLYGGAKLFGESLLRSLHDSHNLDSVALRYFNIYGQRMDTEGKYTEVMVKWLDCIKAGKPPLIYGDGSTSMDFVHVKDVASANITALESDVTDEVFNVGFQRETSLKELLKLLLEANNSNLVPEHRPDNTINPVGKRIADITKAKKMLDFTPTISLEEGLRELSQWYFEIKGDVY